MKPVVLFLALLLPAAVSHAATNSAPTANPIRWPERTPPKPVPLLNVVGTAPRDVGGHGQCRLLRYESTSRTDTYLAVVDHGRPRRGAEAVSIRHRQGRFGVSLARANASEVSFRQSPARRPHGLVIYITGIVDLTPPEEKLVESFRLAGWHVLISHTSHHFMKPRRLVVNSGTIRAEARRLARDVDDQLADKAYAVESLLRYIGKVMPAALRGKRVLVGGSAGALALPAIAARIDPLGKTDALVTIGGGGPIGTILSESTLNPLTLYERRKDAADNTILYLAGAQTRRQVAGLIYADTALDPLRLAPRLRGRPILMLHAEHDQMVPAETGNRLFAAFGQPERRTYPLDHILLFGALHFQSGAVVEWVHRQLLTAPPAPAR